MALFFAAGCSCPAAPQPDLAYLEGSWWYVTLSDGTVCIARPYETPHRDTAAEAVAECRAAFSHRRA